MNGNPRIMHRETKKNRIRASYLSI